MAIDSISSGSVAPLLPTRQQQNNPAAGTDNNAVREAAQGNEQGNRFQLDLATPAAAPTATQTSNAVAQPNPGQRSDATPAAGTNDGGTIVNGLTQQLQQQDNTEPPTSRNSSINYGASGTPNNQQNPSQSGRLVSLSV
ncbi:hypothetical protein [Ferrovibrio sp.]|uniref:hypothetical protein n=1 Tax=Ferrovibrio sp. TaxID=1917215 RepID=UPI002605C4A4|nr:hypothetical protein [Ferrovibrio sp.]